MSNLQKTISLSTEELIVTLERSGKADISQALLNQYFGEIQEAEVTGRKIAAYHSLLARQYAQFEVDTISVTREISDKITRMFGATLTVRLGKTGRFGEEKLIFYHHPDGWLSHNIEKDIIHTFSFPETTIEVQNRLELFLSPKFSEGTKESEVFLPSSIIVNILNSEMNSIEKITKELTEQPGNEIAHLVAQDLVDSLWRGSIIRVQENGETFGTGILLLQGIERFWVIKGSDSAENTLIASLQNRESFYQLASNLLGE